MGIDSIPGNKFNLYFGPCQYLGLQDIFCQYGSNPGDGAENSFLFTENLSGAAAVCDQRFGSDAADAGDQ